MSRRACLKDSRQMSLWDWEINKADGPSATQQDVQMSCFPHREGAQKAAKPVSRGELSPKDCAKPLAGARQHSGRAGYEAGVAAELRVAQDYERRGFPIARRRWRGQAGEIDLIARDGEGLVFVEVKKSRSFDRALERLSRRQIARLRTAAEEYLGTQPRGSLTDVRFDVALLDAHGQIRVIENAFLDW